MTRLKAVSGQFGLIGGICRANSDCILVEEPAPSSPAARWKGTLFILAEPVVEGGRGHQAAIQVIEDIQSAYYACSSPSTTTCLDRAIEQANANLFQRNMDVSGHEKVTVGITCAVVRRKELLLAQVLPGQAYVIHQGEIRAFPLYPSWNPEAATVPPTSRLLALGWAGEINPEFFHSALAAGDRFCLCSSNIGRFLGREQVKEILLYQEPGDVVEQLYRQIHRQGFSEAHAVAVEMQPAVPPQRAPIFTLPGLQERTRLAGEAIAVQGNALIAEVRRLFQRPRKPKTMTQRKPAPPKPPPEPPPEIPDLARPKPRGPWWKTLTETVRDWFRPKSALPHLKRPRVRSRRPSRERRRRFLIPLLGAAALIVLGILVFIIHQENEKRRDAAVLQLIDQAQEQVDQATRADDAAEANRILDEAQDLLEQAQASGRFQPQIELELDHLQQERDQINQVTRFSDLDLVVDLATFSTTVSASDFAGGCLGNCRFGDLVGLGNSVYLLEEEKGTIYLYSPATNEVSTVLWAGVEIEGRVVAPILAIARLDRPANCTPGEETEPWLAAVDADNWLYLHRQGVWEPYALFSESDWAERAIDLEGYQGNVYVLKGELGQILKYYCNAYELAPDPWLENPRQVQAEDAVDMAIDGHIYLLMKDSLVLDLLRGEAEDTLSYEVYPPTVVPIQIATELENEYLYVADRYRGRIIQLRKGTETDAAFVRQLCGPHDSDLEDLRAISVREEQGLFYIVTGAGLYRAVIPTLTPEPSPTAAPSPTP